jgi:hypothetical protein
MKHNGLEFEHDSTWHVVSNLHKIQDSTSKNPVYYELNVWVVSFSGTVEDQKELSVRAMEFNLQEI